MPNTISFPGLGIGEFVLNPVAFSVFGHEIRWYGIIITLAMIVGFIVANRNAKIEKIKSDDVYDLAIFLIVFAMVGARLYYVLMTLDTYDSFYDVIAIWNGGLAIYGGVLAGALTIYIVAKVKKISAAKMYDMVVPGLAIGQAIGRWGNFCNAEAHGIDTTLPWRMGIMYGGSIVTRYYHPTFLYESLWNIVGFVILMLVYKRKKYDGQIAWIYVTWYGLGRVMIEGLRTDSLMLGPIRVSQAVAALSIVLGSIFLIRGLFKIKEMNLENVDYNNVYSSVKENLGFDETSSFEILEPEAEKSEDSDTDTDTNSNCESGAENSDNE